MPDLAIHMFWKNKSSSLSSVFGKKRIWKKSTFLFEVWPRAEKKTMSQAAAGIGEDRSNQSRDLYRLLRTMRSGARARFLKQKSVPELSMPNLSMVV
jgi:hypothetical protein